MSPTMSCRHWSSMIMRPIKKVHHRMQLQETGCVISNRNGVSLMNKHYVGKKMVTAISLMKSNEYSAIRPWSFKLLGISRGQEFIFILQKCNIYQYSLDSVHGFLNGKLITMWKIKLRYRIQVYFVVVQLTQEFMSEKLKSY